MEGHQLGCKYRNGCAVCRGREGQADRSRLSGTLQNEQWRLPGREQVPLRDRDCLSDDSSLGDNSPWLKPRGFSSSRKRTSCFIGNCLPSLRPNRSYVASTGSNREPLGHNVHCSIDITIVKHAAFRTYPFPYVQGKRVYYLFAGTTSLRRGIEPINLNELPPIPLCLVFQLAHKLAPADIRDGLSQTVVLDHILDCQTLHADHLVFMDDACTELVLVVPSAVSNPDMKACCLLASFLSILRAFLLPGMTPLRFGEFLLIHGKIAGIANLLPCRDGHHRLDAQVQPNHVRGDGKRFDALGYQDRDEVPPSRIFGDRDRTGLGIFGQWAVPLDRQRLLHLSQGKGFPLPLEGIGGIGCRLVMMLFLEGGVLSPTFKEVHKRPIQMTKCLLKRNRRNISKPRIL